MVDHSPCPDHWVLWPGSVWSDAAFTVQGQIERKGLFASGTSRADGWAKVALYVLVYGTAALLIAGVAISLVNHESLGKDPTQAPTPVTPTGP